MRSMLRAVAILLALLWAAAEAATLPRDCVLSHLQQSILEPHAPPLTADSIVVDTQIAWAMLNGKNANLSNRRNMVADLESLVRIRGQRDIRIPDVTAQKELDRAPANPEVGFRLFPSSFRDDDKRARTLLRLLDSAKVGGQNGSRDRLIVAQLALASSNGVPVLATADRGIYEPLLRMSGSNPRGFRWDIPNTFFPEGFEVRIGDKRIRVIPMRGSDSWVPGSPADLWSRQAAGQGEGER